MDFLSFLGFLSNVKIFLNLFLAFNWTFERFETFRYCKFVGMCKINRADWAYFGLTDRHTKPYDLRNRFNRLNLQFFSCCSNVVPIVVPLSFRPRCPESPRRATGPPVRLGDFKERHNLSFQYRSTVILFF